MYVFDVFAMAVQSNLCAGRPISLYCFRDPQVHPATRLKRRSRVTDIERIKEFALEDYSRFTVRRDIRQNL
jgi:hypothetical protein